jgi:hypothetical protein
MFSAHSGMTPDVLNRFLQTCNRLISDVLENGTEFSAQVDAAVSDFGAFVGAKKFLQSLRDHCESVCATFTAVHFTAGHVSSQRAESLNSRIKEHGTFKKELSKFNLNQLLDHLLSITRDQNAKSKSLIKAYIKAGHGWSKEVDYIWKE